MLRTSFIFGLLLTPFLWASVSTLGFNRNDNTIRIRTKYGALTSTRAVGSKIAPSLDTLPQTMGAGLPMVPYEPLRIAVPFGFEFESITLEHDAAAPMRGDVVRATGQLPLSWHSQKRMVAVVEKAAPDFIGDRYPANRVDLTIQKLHGVSVALVNVYPVIFNRNGSVESIREANVVIQLRKSDANRVPLRHHQKSELMAFVNNPDVMMAWPANQERGYDYLIVATPDVMAYSGKNGLHDFQANLSSRGLISKVADITAIPSMATGKDAAEKLRNYVRAEYQSSGIRFLLLAGRSAALGSSPVIPARLLWSKIRAYDGHWYDLEENIAADHYFAALDGSFDGNHNGTWGELLDGDDGGDVDFLPELTIGRVVLNTTGQIGEFVKKIQWGTDNKFPRRMILSGEMLFEEMGLYGDEYMDQLIGHCTDHGFATDGYSNDWISTKLYDRKGSWSGADAMAAIKSSGAAMINHLGHSNESYNMRMSSYNIASMANEVPFLYYSQGCLAGKFTGGSFIDKLVSSPRAAIGAIGNTSYGLAPEDPNAESTKTPGASQMLHRQFINALMANPEMTVGQANHQSKLAFVSQKAAQEVRWVTWVATYFGDPSLQMKY